MCNGGILFVINFFCVIRYIEMFFVVGKVIGGKKKCENNQDVLEVFFYKKKEKCGLD